MFSFKRLFIGNATEIGQPLTMNTNVQNLWLIHCQKQCSKYWLSSYDAYMDELATKNAQIKKIHEYFGAKV